MLRRPAAPRGDGGTGCGEWRNDGTGARAPTRDAPTACLRLATSTGLVAYTGADAGRDSYSEERSWALREG